LNILLRVLTRQSARALQQCSWEPESDRPSFAEI